MRSHLVSRRDHGWINRRLEYPVPLDGVSVNSSREGWSDSGSEIGFQIGVYGYLICAIRRPSYNPATPVVLASGTRLGPYEVIGPLGAGGMGEVYRAHDTKLNRDVALKILPALFAQDPERLARFKREAQVLAALDHPNIGAIYGSEDTDGAHALVLQLVAGPTLADRIAQGPVPLGEALPIAKQIAEALEAAHEQGIVHRDLKPANIKVRPEGTVKVLDFGLAKLLETDATGSGQGTALANSPTITTPAMMTGVGMILGTAAYMSPEQAKGRPADKRSDIWAFGCVLYEMLTGREAFLGETISDTLAAVLKEEPDLTRLPDRMRRLVDACLQKDPKQRLQAIGDWRLLLEDATEAKSQATSRAPWALAAAFALVGVFALWAPWRRTAPNHSEGAMRLDVDLGMAVAPTNLGPDAILSPDGTRLVVVAEGANRTSRLLTRRLDQSQSQSVELLGTDGAFVPFFSPDGQWVGFFSRGKLKKTRIDAGEPVTLCDAPAGRGGAWGEDGQIIAALETQRGLSLVPAEGGSIATLTTLAPGESSHRWPQILPGGKTVLFTSSTTPSNYDEASISVWSLAAHTEKIVLERAGLSPRYLPSGHLLYVRKGTLFAVPFDPVRLEVRGSPVVAVEDVSNDTNFGFARLDVSSNGILLYRKGRTEGGLTTVHWMDSTGSLEPLETEPALYLSPRISPDGSKLISIVNQGPNADLWIYDWQRGSKSRVTDGKAVYGSPVWSPDGQYIVFSSSGGMLWTRTDGAGKPQALTKSDPQQLPSSFTPDGRRLVFSEVNRTGGLIQTVLIDGGSGELRANKPEAFLQTSSTLPYPAFSPDGRWLAYAYTESGSYEVYVRAFPDKGSRWLISNGGGTMPRWARNGHELFYRTEDSRIMVVTYTATGDSFIADKPRLWSDKPLPNTGLTPNFDLAPDSKRSQC
jgi:serine/threonine-protein kinase